MGDGTNPALFDTAEVALTVDPVNDAPIIGAPDSLETDEDVPVTFSAENNNALTIADADADETEGAELEVTLTAGSLLTLGSTEDIEIIGGADSSNSVTFTGSLDAINNALDGLVYTPPQDVFGADQLDLLVNDNGATGGSGEGDDHSVFLTINSVNDLPVALDDSTITEEDASVDVFVLINDSDLESGELTVTEASDPEHGETEISEDQTFVIYTPDEDYNGTDSFWYVVADSDGGLDTTTVKLTVTPVNDAPVVRGPETEETDEDKAITFNEDNKNAIAIEDGDADETEDAELTVTLTAGSTVTLGSTEEIEIIGGEDGSHEVVFTGSLDAINNALDGLVYTPTKDISGDGFLRINVNDNGATGPEDESGDLTVAITINPVNDPPVIVSGDPPAAVEDAKYLFQIEAEDLEGDAFEFYLGSGAPAWLTISKDGLLSGTPGASDVTTGAQVVVVVNEVGDLTVTSRKIYSLDVAPDKIAPLFVAFPEVQGVTDTRATVVWASNEPTTGSVAFGPNATPGSRLVILSAAARTDTVKTLLSADGRAELTGLSAGTDYSAQLVIADARDNQTISDAFGFTTEAGPDTDAPVFTERPALIRRTDTALTFAWASDEPAIGKVRLEKADGQTLTPEITDSTEAFDKAGELTVTGLTPGTEYLGRIELTDVTGNGPDKTTTDNNPASITGKTADTPDKLAPILTQAPVAKGVTDTRATIVYETNEPATSFIDVRAADGAATEIRDLDLILEHTGVLTGLTPNTSYYFKVGGEDASGNKMAFTAVDSFKTLATPDLLPPTFTEGPSILAVTDKTAILAFRTSEPMNLALRLAETDSTDTTRVNQSDFTDQRQLTVTGLDPNTEYQYLVSGRDISGNASRARSGGFRTSATADVTAPRLIGGVNVIARGFDRFTVEWETDEVADTHGETGKTLNGADIDAEFFTIESEGAREHSVSFRNLTPATLYYFRVKSTDASSNTFVSAIDSVRTLAAPDTLPPTLAGITADVGSTEATIRWTTGAEPSDSRVVYGTDSTAVTLGNVSVATQARDGNRVREHLISLSGLTADTRYFYRVQSTDESGNRSVLTPTLPKTFRTRASADLTGPVITQISANAQTAQATINWVTDEPSNSTVLYDDQRAIDATPPANRTESATLVTLHTVTLTGLTASKTYRFRVQSADQSGNTSSGPQGVASPFTTTPGADVQAPAIFGGPSAEYVTNTKVIVRWATDELADDRVYFRKSGDTLFQLQPGDGQLKTRHQIELDNLIAGATYEYVVSSKDAAGKEGLAPTGITIATKVGPLFKLTAPTASIAQFTTLTTADTQAPVIVSGPTLTGRSASSATLIWTTDELATSNVAYGAGGVLTQQVENGTLTTAHAVTLTNLTASTVYTFTVSSTDPQNNGPAISAQAVFQTTAQPDVAPPQISGVSHSTVFVSSGDGANATVTWTTDEAADARIEYGTSNALGQSKTVTEASLSHSVTLTRLTAGGTYFYRVSSTGCSRQRPCDQHHTELHHSQCRRHHTSDHQQCERFRQYAQPDHGDLVH